MATVCAECRNLFVTTKNSPWFHWVCLAAPTELKMNHVTGRNDPPYIECRRINDGNCQNFTPGFNRLKPPTVEEHLEGES